MKAHTHQDARTWNPLETDQAHQSAVSWQTEGQPSLVMTRGADHGIHICFAGAGMRSGLG